MLTNNTHAIVQAPHDLSAQRLYLAQQLWRTYETSRAELSKVLYEEREACRSKGGRGITEGFKAWLQCVGVPRATAYRLIADYEIANGIRERKLVSSETGFEEIEETLAICDRITDELLSGIKAGEVWSAEAWGMKWQLLGKLLNEVLNFVRVEEPLTDEWCEERFQFYLCTAKRAEAIKNHLGELRICSAHRCRQLLEQLSAEIPGVPWEQLVALPEAEFQAFWD